MFAFFLLADRYEGPVAPENYRKSEIDFEFLTAQTEQFSPARRNRLYFNIWNDWNQGLYGHDPGFEDSPTRLHDDKTYEPSVDTNFDYANWNLYQIRWLPDRTEFYVNNRLERVEREVLPDEALAVHFNFGLRAPIFARLLARTTIRPPTQTPTFPISWILIS